MRSTRKNGILFSLLLPCLAFAAFVLVVRPLMNVAVTWNAWEPATCMPSACFCESIRDGTVRQVANTWSSLAFVFVSFCVLGVAMSDQRNASAGKNAMTQRIVYPVVFGAGLFVVGVGSAFYHASLTLAGQFADVFGMYLIGTFVLVYNVGRLKNLSGSTALGLYLLINVALGGALYTVPELRRYLFALVVVLALVLEYRVYRRGRMDSDRRFLAGAVVALVAAFAIWILDITKTICAPESALQGHALWHVLGAAACGCVYLYCRSEHKLAPHR